MSDTKSSPNKRLLEEHCEEIFQQLLAKAKKDLQARPVPGENEDDVVISAFRTFIRRDKERKFSELRDSKDLLHMILWLIARKIADKRRRHARRGEIADKKRQHACRGEGQVFGLDTLEAEPAPHLGDMEYGELLDLLDKPPQVADLRQIAVWKLEEYTNQEIASKLACSEATVRRKINEIRSRWSPENLL